MMHGKHTIPQAEDEAILWGENFVNKIEQHANHYLVEQADLDDLKASLNIFKKLVERSKSPESTHVIVVEKKKAHKDFEKKAHAIIHYQLHHPAVTNADRASLNLPSRDRTYNHLPPIASFPIVTASGHTSRHIRLDFRDMNSAGKARPYGVNGAVIACEVLDRFPETPGNLPQIALATRTPYILEFSETQRGQTAYIALCWEDERGQRGPWSDIVSQIIP
ncbi:MAG: hypothetical protein LBH04_04975 [Tannerellaceae bacterium]|jgi:hypothetical protein|nr:hypothetical protein [Tannerellaceae bacterium]